MFAYVLMYSVLGWLIEIDPYNLLNKIKSDIDQDTFVEADETIKVIKMGHVPFHLSQGYQISHNAVNKKAVVWRPPINQ